MRTDRLNIEVGWRDVAEGQFTDLILGRGLRAFVDRGWSAEAGADVALPGEVRMYQSHAFGTDEWLLELADGAVALVQRSAEVVSVRVAANTREQALAVVEQLRAVMPERVPTTSSTRVVFWAISHRGPRALPRVLATPHWAAVADNYPAATARHLTPLFAPEWRPQAGRLLLWRGEPGTGKTHAVRALMQAWRGWCTFHVVLDAEQFFAQDGTCMLEILCGHGDHDETDDKPRWRLLVLEDSGELLGADAALRAGQGLSRLLNLCDGLLGQSLQVLILITTNEDLGRIHPAVSRPGRCLSNIEFAPFDAEAAQRWLCDHAGPAAPVEGPATLAELYARLQGRRVAPRKAAVGF